MWQVSEAIAKHETNVNDLMEQMHELALITAADTDAGQHHELKQRLTAIQNELTNPTRCIGQLHDLVAQVRSFPMWRLRLLYTIALGLPSRLFQSHRWPIQLLTSGPTTPMQIQVEMQDEDPYSEEAERPPDSLPDHAITELTRHLLEQQKGLDHMVNVIKVDMENLARLEHEWREQESALSAGYYRR